MIRWVSSVTFFVLFSLGWIQQQKQHRQQQEQEQMVLGLRGLLIANPQSR
jgi:hypothetical protein